jgi:hypothetical protein
VLALHRRGATRSSDDAPAAVDGTRLRGTLSLLPTYHDERGRRPATAVLFTVTGRFVGRFTFDRATGTVDELKGALVDVAFAWKPRMPRQDDVPPHYRAAFEWVRAPVVHHAGRAGALTRQGTIVSAIGALHVLMPLW